MTNYFALTHTSEPNYVAVVGGEYFGMNDDDLFNVPANVSTIVDLLQSKSITWAEYMQDMPSTCFEGMQFLNAKGANDYVRKHKSVFKKSELCDRRHIIHIFSPLIIYESVTSSTSRCANIKNFTLFDQDLANGALPQWIFITPNMSKFLHLNSSSLSLKLNHPCSKRRS